MIRISPRLQQLLREPVISAFFLVKTSGGLLTTSYFRDVTFNGETFVSDGAILSTELPQMTSVVDRQLFKITMVDSRKDFLKFADQQSILGQTVSVWMALVDQVTGQPELSVTDVLLIYRGTIDGHSSQILIQENGEITFQIDCASPMADLDRTRSYFASQDYADKHFPGDSSYSQLFKGSGPVALRWGK